VRSISSFQLPIGRRVQPGAVRGYYIDLSEKAIAPEWPPPWFPFPGFHRYIAMGQWGLGALERHEAGEPGDWLGAAVHAGDHLVAEQATGGPSAGAWLEAEDYPHTFRMRGPWLSAMAQGHCASVLVRLHLATGREDFAEGARRALAPMEVPTEEGGAMAPLAGRPFPEEYPTTPASYVLNGAIYALFGVYDVGVGLGDDTARRMFDGFVNTLAANIRRWDLGYWSLYDLYPHPGVSNVASASYHALHVNQLRVLNALAPRPELAHAAERFERYRSRRPDSLRALAHKVAFRIVVPRNPLIADRLPWRHPEHRGGRGTGPAGADA
jgi:heparosan-N-sulfate-glucuronate 5-epimerase